MPTLLHLPYELLATIAGLLRERDRSSFCRSFPGLRNIFLIPSLSPRNLTCEDVAAGYSLKELAENVFPSSPSRAYYVLDYPKDARTCTSPKAWKQVIFEYVRGLARSDMMPPHNVVTRSFRWMEEDAAGDDFPRDVAFLNRPCEQVCIENVPVVNMSVSSDYHQLNVLGLFAYLFFQVYRETLQAKEIVVVFEEAYAQEPLEVLETLTSVVRFPSSYDIRIKFEYHEDLKWHREYRLFCHTGSYAGCSSLRKILDDRTIRQLSRQDAVPVEAVRVRLEDESSLEITIFGG